LSKSIAYILEDARFGGMNKMIADVSKGIIEKGYYAHIILGNAHSDFYIQYLHQSKVPYTTATLSVLSKRPVAIVRYVFTFLSDIFTLVKCIRKANPDLVYCNGSQQIKGVIAATLTNRTVIWHMHDTYQPRALLTLFHIVRKLCHVKWFVASCQRSVEFYGLDVSHTLISRPPIDTVFFTNSYTNIHVSGKSPVRILTIANVNTDKGIDTLIRVASQLATQGRSFVFTVVGLGADEGNATYKQAQELIHSLGVDTLNFVGQKNDIRSLLNESDIYLCTSRNESGPISVFEALSMGVPVVSTAVGDLPSLFAKYCYGATCPVGDHQALAGEILHVADNSEEMRQRAEIGRIIAEKELDITICVAGQRSFYSQVFAHGQ
jgi:glycosyltransferase involved in cell wall biosynthesis